MALVKPKQLLSNANPRSFVLILLFLVIAGLDQLSKTLAIRYIAGSESINFRDLFSLSLHENSGFFLGLGSQMETPSRAFFIGIPVFAFIIILLFITVKKVRGSYAKKVGATILLAGVAGNAIDRIFSPTFAVYDFLHIELWPNHIFFNFADIAIVVGLTCIFFIELRRMVSG